MGMKKEFFQITEAARACGLSRSTLLRMEEKGLLTPAYIAPDSGRRYYDNHNVARIMQIEKFKSMGISIMSRLSTTSSGAEKPPIYSQLWRSVCTIFNAAWRSFVCGYGKRPVCPYK